MRPIRRLATASFFCAAMVYAGSASAQIGKRFPSERKVVKDPVTGVDLVFLTSTPAGDSKIYQTHNQWTADGQWLIFRSARVPGEAIAVHEESGEMVQVTEGGYTGMLNIARNSMHLYFMRKPAGGNAGRSEERRVGKEGVSTCRPRGAPEH